MNYDEAPPCSVSRYREMQKALPGVDALQRLVCAHLEAASPAGGMVLVVGAGGGRDVEAIAASMLPFRIAGVAPSIALLDIARAYVPKANAREVVFVHGGYWMKFDRSYWSHFSEGLTARGWAVAMPSYTLAPEARIGSMT